MKRPYPANNNISCRVSRGFPAFEASIPFRASHPTEISPGETDITSFAVAATATAPKPANKALADQPNLQKIARSRRGIREHKDTPRRMQLDMNASTPMYDGK